MTRGWPVRPWMGALAATAAMALMPAVALADDGPSVYEFKLPNKAAAEKLIDLGYDLSDGLDQSQPGFVKATIVASDEEKAQLEAMGYPAVATIQTPADVDALRAARQATIDEEHASVTPPRTYSGPTLVASWDDAAGTQVGTGNRTAYLDTDVTPVAPYLYHV